MNEPDEDDFFLETLNCPEKEFEQFLDRQIVLRDAFKKEGREISRFLDCIYMLYILKNKKTGKHFILKRSQLETCLKFASSYEILDFEKNTLKEFLK